MVKIIGLDLGTTNAKAVLLDEQGAVLAASSKGYGLHSSHAGWAEQEPQEVWEAALEALGQLGHSNLVSGVQGLCLSGAMHTLFPMDRDNHPIAPSMSWADQRATSQASHLAEATQPLEVYQRTGCPINAFYYPARLNWWLAESGLADPGPRFSGIKDWVLLNLTGEWVTDTCMASSTGLLDTRRRTWDAQTLELAGVSPAQLPGLVSPLTLVGGMKPEWAEKTGLPVGLPVVAGGSDGGLANLGSGAIAPGTMVITVGTSGAVRRTVDQPWLDRQARTWCYALLEDRWFVGGAINSAGLAMQWVRDKFYPDLTPEAGVRQMMDDAARIAPGAEGLVLLPYFAGERSPHWMPSLRASLVGLSLEVLEVLTQEQSVPERIFLTGGITQSPVWVQIVTDVIGVTVQPIEAADASAVGAGLIGAYALGLVDSLEAFSASRRVGELYEPDENRSQLYRSYHRQYDDLFHQLYPRIA
jgi:gluconokinase